MLDSLFTEFKLDLAGTKGLAAGHLLSEEIVTGDYTWTVKCWPRGVMPGNEDYVGLSLELPSRPRITRAVFEAFVMGVDDDSSREEASARTSMEVSQGTNGGAVVCVAVWTRFARRSNLVWACAGTASVTIVCGILLTLDDAMAGHIGRMLDRDGRDDNGSDVSFSVGGETFRAHRAVLAARSPVFRAELLGPMAEAGMACITLHDIEPEAFRVLLRFVYTDELPPMDDDVDDQEGLEPTELVCQVLAAADRYALDRLKLLCARRLYDSLSVETVSVTSGYAEMHNCPELKNKCIDFFVADNNFKKAMASEGYMQLEKHFPSVVEDIVLRARAGS